MKIFEEEKQVESKNEELGAWKRGGKHNEEQELEEVEKVEAILKIEEQPESLKGGQLRSY